MWLLEQLPSPKSCSLGVLLTLKFFWGTVVFGKATFKRIYLKHHVLDFFQNTTSSRPFLKVVCYFIYREKYGRVIHFFNCSGFSKRSSLSHPFYHLGWFFYRSGCSHPFFQGLYRTDNFWQQQLSKTLINTTTHYVKCCNFT